MMTKKSLALFSFLFFMISSLLAQNKIPIGEWRAHLPYREFISLTQSSETLFCATPWSVLMIDKEEMSLTFLSKVDGLSNAGMGVIKYSDQHQTLIASYANSIFDLVSENGIKTFEDIKTDGNFTDRTINDIYIDGDFAYFSTGFGVVRFNLLSEEFDFTLNLGIKVSSVAVHENQIYAATEEGLYIAPNSNNLNLQDFSNWTLLDYTNGFPGSYSSNAIAVFNNQVYLDINDELHRLVGTTPELIYPKTDNLHINYLTTEGTGLLVGLRCDDNCAGKTLYINPQDEIKEMGWLCSDRPLHAIEDEAAQIWLADSWRGLRKANSGGGACDRMEFDSPLTHSSSQIVVHNDDCLLYTSPSPRDS